ncbi:MAG: 16S rRNA (cytosine(1402)-N(4))-methyltransferase RsmH [Planctomycetota bacterium]
MDQSEVGHVPVLLDEVLELLTPRAGDVVVDGTLGRGGHAAAIIPRIAGGAYLGMDLDGGNLRFAEERLRPIAEENNVRLITVQGNFAGAGAAMKEAGLAAADCLLADLGFASNQMDDPGRGFSFAGDGPLDMRLAPGAPENDHNEWADDGFPPGTAAALVNTLPERELADVIYRYGEERRSRQIARKIIERRSDSPILKTNELAEICRRAYGPSAQRSKIHPATRTFQGLRIAVNGELDALDALLQEIPALLNPGGRAGIISFHSLEDRPVKQAFLKLQQDDLAERLTRKPLTAGPEELARNPRSRSAKLRGIRRC